MNIIGSPFRKKIPVSYQHSKDTLEYLSGNHKIMSSNYLLGGLFCFLRFWKENPF